MALSNLQYRSLEQYYEALQAEDQRIERRRLQEVLASIPAMEELNRKLMEQSIATAKECLSFPSDSPQGEALLQKGQQANRELIQQKHALLAANGFPETYLDPIFHCADCKDTGRVGDKFCHCYQQALSELLYDQSGIRSQLEQENFKSFSLDYYTKDYLDPQTGVSARENIQTILHILSDYLEHFSRDCENLLFYGNTGVGKTFLTNCLARELLDAGHTVLYFSAPALFDLLGRHRFGKGTEDYISAQQVDQILTCDLLVIDDLGTELNNAFVSSQLYQCMNERQQKKRSTIISTNLSFEDLSTRYSERVFSRLAGNYRLIRVIGEDIRLKKAL